jgi:hypothetical protein
VVVSGRERHLRGTLGFQRIGSRFHRRSEEGLVEREKHVERGVQ